MKNSFLPCLVPLQSTDACAVDWLSDHKRETRVNHYGRSDALCNGQSEPDTSDFIVACRVWHSSMDTFPVDKSWPAYIVNTLLLIHG